MYVLMYMCFPTVTIDVDYTPPVDFDRPSLSDYRAGSGPVTLTCQVEGATGTVTYSWSSECSGTSCVEQSGTDQSLLVTSAVGFLRAGVDDGTYTCTATDSVGVTGSADTVISIIGMFCAMYQHYYQAQEGY